MNMPADVKVEKVMEAYIKEIEKNTGIKPKDCPVLRANISLMMKFKNETHRQIINEIGPIVKDIDTHKCSCTNKE